MPLTRRALLKSIAWLTASVPLALRLPSARAHTAAPSQARPEAAARVVIVKRPEVLFRPGAIAAEDVESMVADGICRLTSQRHPRDAWLSIFSPFDRIGIKVNALGGRTIGTRPELAHAVARQMTACGIPPKNILIWDRLSSELKTAGFHIRRGGNQIQCYGTDKLYEPLPSFSGSIGSCFSRLLARECDALISIPVLKDHDLAGVSLSLKSFYGAIHNPNKYHDNNCDPYIADLNEHPYIREKLRLIIVDGLTGQCNGGPAYRPLWSWPYSGLLLSRDAVAADLVGAEVIADQRKKMGLPSLKEAGRHPSHISTAAGRSPNGSKYNNIAKIYI